MNEVVLKVMLKGAMEDLKKKVDDVIKKPFNAYIVNGIMNEYNGLFSNFFKFSEDEILMYGTEDYEQLIDEANDMINKLQKYLQLEILKEENNLVTK